jgi:hypothetical protein
VGTLFPDYPDHKPIPSPFGATKTSVFAFLVGLAPLCPALEHKNAAAVVHEAPRGEPIEAHPPVMISVNASGPSSSSDDVPLTWMNNSTLDAADVAIRNGFQRQAAQTRIAAMSSSGSFITS